MNCCVSIGTTAPRMPLGPSLHLPLSGCVGVHHTGRVHPGTHRQRLLLHAGRGPPGPEVVLNPKHVCGAEASATTRGINTRGTKSKKSPAERKIFTGQREQQKSRQASPATSEPTSTPKTDEHTQKELLFYNFFSNSALKHFPRKTSVIRRRK